MVSFFWSLDTVFSQETRAHSCFFARRFIPYKLWPLQSVGDRCTLPRLWWLIAKSARSTENSRLLNTRKARTPNRLRERVATLPSSPDSEAKPSLSSGRRPSKPRRSPWNSSAPRPRPFNWESLAGAKLSSSVPIPPRTRPAPSSESSNASGKALANRYRDELCGIGRATSSLQLFSQQFLFFIIYIAIALSYRLCAI